MHWIGSWFDVVLLRWLHVASACLLVGAAFFVAFLLSPATRELDESSRRSLDSRVRRGFKMLVHTCILLSLISGTYNLIVNRDAYHRTLPLSHALLGLHVLLALGVFVVLLLILARRETSRGYLTWVRLTVGLLLLAILVASALKWVREHPPERNQQTTS